MDILHIDRLDYLMGNGCTDPIVATAKDKKVVVKLFNNVQGNKTLVNELVCYLIANKLGLTIPDAGICLIDCLTEVDDSILAKEIFSDLNYGLGFYSTYIPNATIINSSKLIEFSNNYSWMLPSIMLFDNLVFNKDRNKGNLLITNTKANKNIFIIDHSHTFNLQCLWNGYQLQRCISEQDIHDIIIMDTNKYLYSLFSKVVKIDLCSMNEAKDLFNSRLNREFFYNIVNNIPIEWEKDKSELKILADYIYYRFVNLDTLSNNILTYKY